VNWVSAISQTLPSTPSGVVLTTSPAPYPYQVCTLMKVRASTMVKVCSMTSILVSPSLSVHLNTTKIFKFIKVWAIVKQSKPIEVSTNIWLLSKEKPDIRIDEFVVTSSGTIRSLIEWIRKEAIFTDTGKRVQFNTNLWGEVWRIRPEHLALLQEKETQDEQATNHSISEHQL
jgi:hypothetical protein